MGNSLLFLSETDIRQLIDMPAALRAAEKAFLALSGEGSNIPLRTHTDIPEENGVVLYMPGCLPREGEPGIKIVTLFRDNTEKNLPRIHAVILLIDRYTGRPCALMGAEHLTALRTGAASGVATKLLARPEASALTIIGAGIQGRTQMEAVCAVREISQVFVFDIDREKANEFAQAMSSRSGIPVSAAEDLQVLRESDIICAATSAGEPVVHRRMIRPGTHINAIGAYKPDHREIDSETIKDAFVVVDQHEAALREAGDLIIPIREKKIGEDHIRHELGDLLADPSLLRRDDRTITLFKSVGNAAQDLTLAGTAYREARRRNIGRNLALE